MFRFWTGLALIAVLASGCSGSSSSASDSTSGGSGSGSSGSGGGSSGSSGNSGSTGDAGPSAQQTCADFGHAACAAIQSCPTTAPIFPSQWSSTADCEAYFTGQCLPNAALDDLPGVAAPVDGGVASCLGKFESLSSCDLVYDLLFNQNLQSPFPECVKAGSLDDGAPCVEAKQCASLNCSFASGCGVCAERKAVGDACGAITDCPFGSTCANGLCTSYAARGTSCTASVPCAPGLACVQGQCADPLPDGASCQTNARADPCLYGQCVAGTCVAYTFDQDPGEECGYNPATGSFDFCRADSTCNVVDTTKYLGACALREPEGARCVASTGFEGPSCAIGLGCVDGVCRSLAPACLADGGQPGPEARDAGVTPVTDEVRANFHAESQVLCQGLDDCRTMSPYLANLGGLDGCITAYDAVNLEYEVGPPALANPDAGAELASCVATLNTLDACTRAELLFGLATFPPNCEVSTYLAPDGAPCNGSFQCASTSCSSVGVTCGECVPTRPTGGACTSDGECATGSRCVSDRCVVPGGPDAGCSSTSDCALQLWCVNGVCTPGGEEDAGCDINLANCRDAMFCNPGQHCQLFPIADVDAGPPALADGGPGPNCGIVDGTVVLCPFGYQCPNFVNGAGICAPAGGLGGPCTFVGGQFSSGDCELPFTCVDGTCELADTTYCQ